VTGTVATIRVGFGGVAGGDGPLTLGQRNVLRWLGADPRADVLPEFVEVPPGRTVADVAAALRVVLARHEALRTCFPGGSVQRVLPAGELELAVHPQAGDRAALVGALVWESMGVPFDVAAGLPVRAAVVTDAGDPVLLVLLFSHAAVDAAGAAIVRADCAALLAGATFGAPAGHQPRDQADWERSAGGRRRTRAALRHWETLLRRVPQAMLPVPHPDGVPGRREVRMRSAALAAALPAVLARTGAGPSAVLLAATAAVVAARTGRPAGAVVSICGNRFRTDWRDYVGPLAQDALVPYDLGPLRRFDEVVRQVQGATMGAYRHAHFDSAELWPVIDAVGRDRGTHFHRDLVFNDLGAHADLRDGAPAGPAGPVPATVLQELPARALPTALVLTLGGVAPGEVDLRLHADTRYVPDVEAVLLGIERLVAAGPVALADVGAVTGLRPVRPGPGWATVDGNLVDLAACRDLLPAGSTLELRDGRLAARVPGGAGPAAVHATCLARLPGHPAAMTPHRYTVGEVTGTGR
jgi:hypothetical protein